jgi:hypothetical protein
LATNLNNGKLKVLRLREYSVKERIEALQQGIAVWQPKLVFIDGVRDLVKDSIHRKNLRYGKPVEKLSSKYDCHICSVLHENKGGGQLRGHLGTELLNQSETVISVKTEDNITTVSHLQREISRFKSFISLLMIMDYLNCANL